MEEAITYNFSKGIRQAKKQYKTMSILLPILLTAFAFLSPLGEDLSTAEKAGTVFFSLIVLGLTIYFSATNTIRKLSELSIYLFPDRLEREDRKQKEFFFWRDILHTEILEYPNGETVRIKMVFANKKAITLFRFEDMAAAAKQITQYIPDNNLLHRKRAKINWDNPAIIIISGILPIVIILAIQEMGIIANQFFNVVFFFAVGLYILIARPISRSQGKARKKFETVMGIILIVCSIFILAIQLVLVLVLK